MAPLELEKQLSVVHLLRNSQFGCKIRMYSILFYPPLSSFSFFDSYSGGGILVEINAHSLFSKWFSESGKLVMKMFQHITELVEEEDVFVALLIGLPSPTQSSFSSLLFVHTLLTTVPNPTIQSQMRLNHSHPLGRPLSLGVSHQMLSVLLMHY